MSKIKKELNKNVGNFGTTKSKPTSLMGITERLIALENEIEEYAADNEGEISESLIRKEAELSIQDKEKVDSLIYFLKNMRAKSELYKKEAAIFNAKKQTAENVYKRMLEYIKYVQIIRKQKTIEGDLYKFRIQKNGGLPKLVIRKNYTEEESYSIVNEGFIDNIPEKYLIKKEIIALDKEAIKEDLWQFEKNIKEQAKKKKDDFDELYRSELENNKELQKVRRFAMLKRSQGVRLV